MQLMTLFSLCNKTSLVVTRSLTAAVKAATCYWCRAAFLIQSWCRKLSIFQEHAGLPAWVCNRYVCIPALNSAYYVLRCKDSHVCWGGGPYRATAWTFCDLWQPCWPQPLRLTWLYYKTICWECLSTISEHQRCPYPCLTAFLLESTRK